MAGGRGSAVGGRGGDDGRVRELVGWTRGGGEGDGIRTGGGGGVGYRRGIGLAILRGGSGVGMRIGRGGDANWTRGTCMICGGVLEVEAMGGGGGRADACRGMTPRANIC